MLNRESVFFISIYAPVNGIGPVPPWKINSNNCFQGESQMLDAIIHYTSASFFQHARDIIF